MKTKEGIELREAAERIFNGEDNYCCHAIKDFYAYYSFNRIYSKDVEDLSSWVWFGYPLTKKTQNRRIIALLLAEEIADSGGL